MPRLVIGTRRGRLATAAAGLAATAALAAAGCAAPGVSHATAPRPAGGGPATGSQVRLLVRDGDLRVAGSDCAGGGGYAFLHHTAAYTLTTTGGQPLSHGTLPSGHATPALTEDTGNARVVPTYCEFAFTAPAPSAAGYQLVVGGRTIPLGVSARMLAAELP